MNKGRGSSYAALVELTAGIRFRFMHDPRNPALLSKGEGYIGSHIANSLSLQSGTSQFLSAPEFTFAF